MVRLIGQDAEKRGVEVECKVSREAPKALVDPERMGQALLNLCINALDAMPEGGTLDIGARLLPADDDGTTWYAMAQATLNQLDCDIERLFEWLGDYEPDTPTPEVPS